MTSSSDRPESWTQLLARPEEAVSSEELARHLQNLIQVFPYLDESSQAALSHALASSPMAKSRELGAVWADTAYGVATTACRAALLSISSQDTLHPDTLGRAAHYVKLLQVEDQLMVQPDHERTASQAQPEDLVPATAPLTHHAMVAHIAKANFSGTLREATQNAGYSPVLASDCDGTTWSGDIGEDFFDAAIEDRWFEPEALPLINAFGTRIGIAPFNDATEGARTLQAMHASGDLALRGEKHGIDKTPLLLEYYELQGRAFVGKPISEVKERTRAIFEARMAAQVFPDIQALFSAARSAGILPVAVSASCQWQVEVGASYLGVPPRLCLGVRSSVVDGRAGPELTLPMTYGMGKVQALRTISARPPVFAIGDSWQRTDKELLLDALVGLVVVHDDAIEIEGLHPFYIPS